MSFAPRDDTRKKQQPQQQRLAVSADGATSVDVELCPATHRSRVVKRTLTTHSRAVAHNALKELDVLLALQGKTPHVVQLLEYRLDGPYLLVAQELCERGDLFDVLRLEAKTSNSSGGCNVDGLTTSEPALRRTFRQIVRGVAELHHVGFAHMDLSLENVLVRRNGDVCLTDFGAAQRFNRDARGKIVPQVLPHGGVAKPAYAAPEQHVEAAAFDVTKADAWALGVLLWMLVTRTPLVQSATSDDALFRRMQSRGAWWALESTRRLRHASWELRDLLHRLLDPSPASRLSVDSALQHPWLRSSPPSLSSSSSSSSKASKEPSPKPWTRLRSRSSGSRVEISLEATRVPIAISSSHA
ncbi:hypothetical protein PINS_up000110 [Pythium insidiosum]|nr:hypothetical protein PINS_up000110 [Pythium insidiosum]